ncbi:MAG: CapA family protein [Minisyncoccia bacterium]
MRRSGLYPSLAVLLIAGVHVSITERPQILLTSTVIHSVHRAPQAYTEKNIQVLVVGDIMLDRYIRSVGESKGYEYVFSCVADTLASYDAVIGNLEGPVTPHASVSQKSKLGEQSNTQFTFSSEGVSALKMHGFTAVSLGNNHIRDFGREGAQSTVEALEKEGIAFAGIPQDSKSISTTMTINGVPLTLIPYNQFLGSTSETFSALKDTPPENIALVFPHWGNEYSVATAYQKELAKQFVDAGADVVVGAHPHVIQENETINGVPVFYSLGNFIFDQYWDSDVRTGKGVVLTLNAQGVVGVEEKFFTLMRDGRTCPREVPSE